jgi:hypothetical protein
MPRHFPFIDARHLDEVTAQIARLLGVPLPQKPPFSSDPAWGMRHSVDSCLKVV